MPSSPHAPALSRSGAFSRLWRGRRSALLALLGFGSLALIAQAAPPPVTPSVVLDFQALEQNDGSFHSFGGHYEEDGYQVDITSSFPNPPLPPGIDTIGTGASPQYCGSTAIHTNIDFGIITVTPIAGGSFTPVSIKLAVLVNPNVNGFPIVAFGGRRLDGSFVHQSFAVTAPYGTQQSFTFNASFTDIVALSCTEGFPFFQVDDIGIEPGSIHTTYATLYAQGSPVPSAGTVGEPRIQAGAVWSGFGPPAINDAGDVAFIGKWKAPAVTGTSPVPAQSGVGIFVNDVLVVKVGEAANLGGDLWKSFKDPVIADDGSMAWLGALKGLSVTPATDAVAAYWKGSAPVIVAREGDPAPVPPSQSFLTQNWKTFSSIARVHGAFALTGNVTRSVGTPATVPILAAGLDDGELRTLIQRDVPLDGGGTTTISFSALKAGTGSPGQGRGGLFIDHAAGGVVRVIANVKTNTALPLGMVFNVDTGAAEAITFQKTLGLLSIRDIPADGAYPAAYLAYRATTGSKVSGIFTFNAFVPIVATGSADGAPAGTTWRSFKDPVHSSVDDGFAFAAQLKGATSANDDGLWWVPQFGTPHLVAREGDHPPGAPAGARWKSFSSLALPGGTSGPIFTAMLQKGPGLTAGPGGITSIDDLGLYGVDSIGTIVELVRENQPLLGKTVQTFNVIKAVAGSSGSSRSFNASGAIVVLVTFTDKTTALIRISVPQLPPVAS